MNSRSAVNEAKREQHDHAGLAEREGDADQRHHHPPRLDARVEVVDRPGSARRRRSAAASTQPTIEASDQHGDDAAEAGRASARSALIRVSPLAAQGEQRVARALEERRLVLARRERATARRT